MKRVISGIVAIIIIVVATIVIYWGSTHQWNFREFSLATLFSSPSEASINNAQSNSPLSQAKDTNEEADESESMATENAPDHYDDITKMTVDTDKDDHSDNHLTNMNASETVADSENVAITKKALKRLKKRADDGDDLAYYQLGLLYENGVKGIKADPEEAKKYYQYLADKGYAKAKFRLGYLYAQEGKRKETFSLYQQAADKGYDIAQHNIAYFYENDSEYRDYDQAAHYYALAADQGLNQSINNLASFYYRGLGVDRNVNMALKLYLHSFATRPNSTALNNIALIYDQAGLYEEAVKYHQLAADNGNVHSLLRLGMLALQGDPNSERSDDELETDYKRAAQYFHLASEAGNVESHIQLGNLYAAGWGVEKDGQYALYHFRLAAEKGNSFGYLGLAQLYDQGDLVTQDHNRAFDYLIAAHKAGNPQADYLLGIRYLQGEFELEADLEKAEYYLRRAAVQTTMPAIQTQALQFFTPVESDKSSKKE